MMSLRTAKIVKNHSIMYSKKTIKKLKDYFAKHDQKSNIKPAPKHSSKPPAGKDGKDCKS